MPRDSNGTYTLPAGNPVVTLTTISSNWANTTLSDIGTALTDSLDRAGSGAMTGQLKLVNGTAGAPGMTWGTETTSGWYRNAANDLRFSVASADKLAITPTLVSTTVPIGAPNGTAGAPSQTFSGDLDLGAYRVGADSYGISAGGTLRLSVDTTSITPALPIYAIAGAVGAPSYAFAGDPNTGPYSVGADSYGIATGGVLRLTIDTTSATSTLPIRGPAGSAATPALSLSTEPDCGFYVAGTNAIGTAVNGAKLLEFNVNGILLPNGSAATPSLAFDSDPNTGWFRNAADELYFSEGGSGFRVGYRILPYNQQNGNYTLVALDSGKLIHKDSGAGNTITIPSNASVPFDRGTAATIYNRSGNSVTIAITSDTLVQVGTGSTGSRTLANNGLATIVKFDTTAWFISGTGIT